MGCLLHNWGWPRKRGDQDVQVCAKCGSERVSKIQFAGQRPAAEPVAAPEPLPSPVFVLRRRSAA